MFCFSFHWFINSPYIVEHNANEHINRNSEEVQNGASWCLWDVLRSQFHDWRPKDPDASLEDTKQKKLDMPRYCHHPTLLSWRGHKKLSQQKNKTQNTSKKIEVWPLFISIKTSRWIMVILKIVSFDSYQKIYLWHVG